jgi:hypothetical protein
MIAVKTGNEEDLSRLEVFLRDACKKAGITYVRGV